MVHHCWTTQFSWCTTAGLHSSHGAPLLDYTVLMVCYCWTTVFMVCKMLLLDYRVLMVCYYCSMQFSRCVTAGLYCFHGIPLLDYIVLMANHQLTTSFSRCVTASLYGTLSLSLEDEIQTHKRFKRTLFIRTKCKTQHANESNKQHSLEPFICLDIFVLEHEQSLLFLTFEDESSSIVVNAKKATDKGSSIVVNAKKAMDKGRSIVVNAKKATDKGIWQIRKDRTHPLSKSQDPSASATQGKHIIYIISKADP